MTDVELRPWSADDLDLLRRANTPELMDQLGGVESDEQVIARHERYLRLWREGTGFQFRIVDPRAPRGRRHRRLLAARRTAASRALEAGWSVEAEYRGRGIAPAAVIAMLDIGTCRGRHPARARVPAGRQPGLERRLPQGRASRSCGEADFEVTPGQRAAHERLGRRARACPGVISRGARLPRRRRRRPRRHRPPPRVRPRVPARRRRAARRDAHRQPRRRVRARLARRWSLDPSGHADVAEGRPRLGRDRVVHDAVGGDGVAARAHPA